MPGLRKRLPNEGCGRLLGMMVRPAGIEPTAPDLGGRCSIRLSYGRRDGAPGWTRTSDRRSRSPLLCPLSYRREVGSRGWVRTSGHLINSQALYRLSYPGVSPGNLRRRARLLSSFGISISRWVRGCFDSLTGDWRGDVELNHGPAGYEAAALPPELPPRFLASLAPPMTDSVTSFVTSFILSSDPCFLVSLRRCVSNDVRGSLSSSEDSVYPQFLVSEPAAPRPRILQVSG